MTTLTQAPTMILAEPAQALIDARLDTIERMLLGQVSRADRLAIVREVEAQLYDLLAERNPDDTDRDAVIAALARLDPPEAYLADEMSRTLRPLSPRHITAPGAVSPASPAATPTTGRVGAVLGVVSALLLLPLAATFYLLFGPQEAGWTVVYLHLGLGALTILTSGLAVTLCSIARLQGAWSVTGFTTGLIALPIALIPTVIVLFDS